MGRGNGRAPFVLRGLNWPSAQSSEPANETARVDSRITNSGLILWFAIVHSRFSSEALIPSMMVFTASPPIASIGCRTVVREGADKDDGATSSNPVTEH